MSCAITLCTDEFLPAGCIAGGVPTFQTGHICLIYEEIFFYSEDYLAVLLGYKPTCGIFHRTEIPGAAAVWKISQAMTG
jgi:hypothetical protein